MRSCGSCDQLVTVHIFKITRSLLFEMFTSFRQFKPIRRANMWVSVKKKPPKARTFRLDDDLPASLFNVSWVRTLSFIPAALSL